MFVYLYAGITFLLPGIFFLIFFFIRSPFSFQWWAWLGALLLMYLLIYETGGWPYIGFFWRYILLLIFIILAWFRFKSLRKKNLPKKTKILSGSIALLFCGLLTVVNAEVFRGDTTDENYIDLEFPLANGTYVIQQGGDSRITNVSHRYRIPASNAYDIIKLNQYGMRSKKLTPKDVTDYAIYNDTVYAPCDGIVLSASNGIADNIPPFMNTIDRGGNYVILLHDDVKIILCHLKINSLMVKKGQQIKAGTPLGLVGNSGFSIEPHLHIQAYHNSIRGDATDQVPIRFNGRAVKMNDIIEKH